MGEIKIYAGIAIILALIASIWFWSDHEYKKGQTDLLASQAKHTVVVQKQQDKITTQVETKYVDRIQVVKEKGDTIIQKVPTYVTVKDDSACVVNAGFVRLWNSSNGMQVPSAASSADDTASSIVLSGIAKQHAEEATICEGTTTQLISLQGWVRQQVALH